MLKKETEHLFRGNPGGRRTSAWTWSRGLQRFESDEPIAKKQVVWVYSGSVVTATKSFACVAAPLLVQIHFQAHICPSQVNLIKDGNDNA